MMIACGNQKRASVSQWGLVGPVGQKFMKKGRGGAGVSLTVRRGKKPRLTQKEMSGGEGGSIAVGGGNR